MWLLCGDGRGEIRLRSTAMDPTVFGESSRADCSALKDGSPRGFLGISYSGGSSGRFAPSCGELEISKSVQTAWCDSDLLIPPHSLRSVDATQQLDHESLDLKLEKKDDKLRFKGLPRWPISARRGGI